MNPSVQLQYLYADVFAFTQSEITIAPVAYTDIQVIARVLTADQPVHLSLSPDVSGFRLWIFAFILDQPVSVSVAGEKPIVLELGPGTENMGVRLSVFPGEINLEYKSVTSPLVYDVSGDRWI